MKDKKTLKLLISVVLALAICFSCLGAVSVLVEDKLSDGRFLDKQNIEEFYELDKNTVDVLTVGTSQVMSGFSAPELFGQYGISAYGLGTCSQPLFASYYWILEALKTQSPKVILLETSSLFGKNVANEMSFYKAFCSMKNTSKYKYEALKIVDEEIISGGIDKLGYYSKLYKFHSRWDEIGKSDYAFLYNFKRLTYGGSAVLEEILETPLNRESLEVEKLQSTSAPKEELSVIYFEKIAELCKEKGIKLILFKTPKSDWGSNQYTVTSQYAEKYSLEYIDFNTPEMLDILGIDLQYDFADVDHLNMTGAKKVTDYLGKYLSENFDLEDYRNDSKYDSYTETYDNYLKAFDSAMLSRCTNFSKVLDYISASDSYSYAVLKRGVINVSEEILQKALMLGIDCDFSQNQYFFISCEGKEIDSKYASNSKISISGYYSDFTNYQTYYKNNKVYVSIFGKSVSSDADNCILVNVYDKNLQRVIFTGVFDENLNKIK